LGKGMSPAILLIGFLFIGLGMIVIVEWYRNSR
jgi:hypothetical protein